MGKKGEKDGRIRLDPAGFDLIKPLPQKSGGIEGHRVGSWRLAGTSMAPPLGLEKTRFVQKTLTER